MQSRLVRAAFVVTVFLSAIQLVGQNAANPIEVALLRWYPANLSTQISTCPGTTNEPTGLAFDGTHIWVACDGSNQVEEFNSSDLVLVRTITLTVPANALVYDGANIWTSTGASVVKIQASTGTVLGTFTVPGANGLAFDGQYVWAAGTGTNNVSKVLATTGAVTTYAEPTCANPLNLAFDGVHIWATCFSAGGGGTTVLELNSTGGVVATVTVGADPNGIAFDGTNMWVTNWGAATVSRINISTLVVTSFAVGSNPGGIAYDGKFIWVANQTGASLTKLMASSGAVKGTFTTFAGPGVVAFDGGNIWVGTTTSHAIAKF